MVTEWSQKEIYMPASTDGFASNGGYISNKEQLRNEDGTANSTVKFYNQNYRVSTYLDDSKITYQLFQAQDTINPDTTFQVEMRFHKVKENNKIYPYNERKEYHNYYLGHMSAASERTPIVNSVIKKEVYLNTDVIFSNSKSGFRHWIVARTGAQLSEVEMTFNGQTTLNINSNDELIITTTIGNIVYTQANAYTMNSNTGALTLLSWQPSYSISGNSVSLIGYGTWSGTLVLEFGERGGGAAASPVSNMNLEWSTYFGGISNDRFDAIETDEANNVWTVGRTQSAFFQAFNGETIGSAIALDDALAVKFDSICQALFLVYYGGSSYDKFVSLAVTSDNSFYAVGSSQSSDIINESEQSIDYSYHGNSDGLFVKFDAQGIVIVDSFIGGNSYDRLSDIDVYEAVNSNIILLVGDTSPDASFEPTPEANSGYFQNAPAGNIDGFIIRLSGTNELQSYCTYFGGNNLDFLDDVEFLNGNVIIGGRTSTSTSSVADCNEPSNGNFPFCEGNNSWSQTWFENQTYHTNYFLALLNWENGNLDWCTYIGPAHLEGDIKYLDMEVISNGSESGDLLVSTKNLAPSPNNVASIPLQNFGNYNQSFGGGETDNGLYWFTIQGLSHQLKWCSYFGGSGDEDIASIDIDPVSKMIYVVGGGTKPSVQTSTDYCNVPTNGDFPICNSGGTSSYMETDIDGDNQRTYIACFSPELTPKWITEFGHGNGNASTGLSISNDKLFVVGYSNEEWTEWQYDDAVETDFYLTRDPTADFANDACIARFGTSQLVGLDENKLAIDQSNLLIYPNPTSATFNIAVGQLYLSETIVIYNVIGELIYSQKVNSYQQLQLDTAKWSSGVYVVALKSNFNSSVKLIVK